MKLIIAIIQDEDASEVISHLNEAKFQVTRLSTKGGFLRAGNTTIMTGVEDEKVEGALKIIEENSKARTQYATLPSSCGAMHGLILAPIEVKVGGATVFVLDVEQFHKYCFRKNPRKGAADLYTFEEIRGNTPLVEQLRRAAASGRSSHAYLFLGGAGAGKRLIANTFAKALQCEGEKRPCDSCKSCHAFNHGNHPDVIYFQPLKNGKTYTIEDVREQLLETVDLKPFQYEKKIYIIEKADTLNIQSQNALLKTLEEPPAHAVFLLLAERAEAFLPTILSRVVVMKIRPLKAETIADYLMQAGHLAEESHILSAYAQGRIGQALELVEDEGFREMRQDILGKLEVLPSMSEGDAYLLAKDLEGYKNDLRFLDIMELWYRDLLTAKSLR